MQHLRAGDLGPHGLADPVGLEVGQQLTFGDAGGVDDVLEVAETLGEQVFNYVLLNKRKEWQEYRSQVTPFELKSNLEML